MDCLSMTSTDDMLKPIKIGDKVFDIGSSDQVECPFWIFCSDCKFFQADFDKERHIDKAGFPINKDIFLEIHFLDGTD